MEVSKTVLSIKNLKIAFGEHVVLDEFSLELNEKEHIVVIGKSGSGKSVLIKCIIGLLKPDYGDIILKGKHVQELSETELDRIRVSVGFLFQSNALYDSMTVRENLEFPLRRHWMELKRDEIDEKVKDVLADVGLSHTVDLMPEELSGGMKKRIALARTLIMKPEIILYDEPTTGLDPITGKEIIDLMNKIKLKYGTAALIISHDMNCVKYAADKIALLSSGKCHTIDIYSNLLKSEDEVVKAFFKI